MDDSLYNLKQLELVTVNGEQFAEGLYMKTRCVGLVKYFSSFNYSRPVKKNFCKSHLALHYIC